MQPALDHPVFWLGVKSRMTDTKVALVGAGYWASQAHLPALLSLDAVDVVGIADPDLTRAQTLAGAHGIPLAVASLDILLDQARPEVVVIATPTETHASLIAAAIAAGAAVFCEKPLVNSARSAADLAALARAAAAPCTVGYSFRYAPALQALRRDISQGVLGEPWLLEMFEYNAQFHPSLGKPVGWKGDPRQARAGALLEYGSHLLDLAGWLAGDIEAVHASFARVLPGARLDDIATLQMRFREPATGILVAGWVLSGGVPGIKVRFHGSAGLGEAEVGFARTGVHAYRRLMPDGRGEDVPLAVETDGVWLYALRHLEDLLFLTRGLPTPYPGTLPTFTDGARVQQVIDAALQDTAGWAAVVKE
jgi:predicted dehydrogenase